MEKPINIAIIDYRMSNMFSIKNALDILGYKSQITSKGKEILAADGAVLPGVGSFPEAMKHLHHLNLIEPIKEFIASGKPFLGICLGLQLLFNRSEEFKQCDGLGIIGGTVESFSKYQPIQRIPHVGWNTVQKHNLDQISKIDLDDNEYFYFIHSYFVKPENHNNVFTTTKYSEIEFCSSIVANNIFASQFHPEKSGPRGLKILKEFFS